MSSQVERPEQMDALARAFIESQNMRLMLAAFFDQTTLLIDTIDEKLENVRTGSDPAYSDLWKLRNFYELWLENEDDPRLTAFFDELSNVERE